MDGVRGLLDLIRDQHLASGRLRGLFHLLIGKTLTTADGTVISSGLTWRQLARELREARFDKNLVKEVGADPDTLSPRDRERLWYSAIGLADISSPEAAAEAAQLTKALKPLGVTVVTPGEATKKKK